MTIDDALDAHQLALRQGGRDGILNLDQIKSAIGRPYSGYHRPIARKASALIHSVIKNHAFTDGNKRTALILADLLIERSGYELAFPVADGDPSDQIEAFVIAVEADMPFEQIVAWFKRRIHKANR